MITLKNINKSFYGVQVLFDMSFELKEGSIVGFLGENGAGKSTIMNIIGGVLQPDSGTLEFKGKPYEPESPSDAIENKITFIHQELNLLSNLTVAENLMLDRFPKIAGLPLINKRKMFRLCQNFLDEINVDIKSTDVVEDLPPGTRQMVEIAKALLTDAELYLFDEPTTSLTAKESAILFKLIRKLKENGKTIIYISHILSDVKNLTDELVILRDGKLVATGKTADYTTDRMVMEMVGSEMENIFPPYKNTVTEKLKMRVERLSQPGMVKDISFKVRQGEVVGFFGLMGSGRTELARMIFGIDSYREGEVYLNGELMPKNKPDVMINNGAAFITEDRRSEGLLMNLSIDFNLSMIAAKSNSSRIFKRVSKRRLDKIAEETSKSLRLKANNIYKQKPKNLSGGNQQKVVIGKWLPEKPEIFLVDEPTRGIDVKAKYEVYTILNQLAENGSGIIFISSELEELQALCDRIIVMSRGEIIREFLREEFDTAEIVKAAFREGYETTGEV